jgi:hypothetical protein
LKIREVQARLSNLELLVLPAKYNNLSMENYYNYLIVNCNIKRLHIVITGSPFSPRKAGNDGKPGVPGKP